MTSQFGQCKTVIEVDALTGPRDALISDIENNLEVYAMGQEMWEADTNKMKSDDKREEQEAKMEVYYSQVGENAEPGEMKIHWTPLLNDLRAAAKKRQASLYASAEAMALTKSMASLQTVPTPNRTATGSHPTSDPYASDPLRIIARMQLIESTLPSFNGEAWRWDEFWVQFVESVDQVQELSQVHKLRLLRKCLKGEPTSIEDFQLSESNYKEAVELLKRRYGKSMDARLQLHRKVESMKANSRSWDDQMTLIIKLRPLLIDYVRLNKSNDHTAVYDMILGKFSEDILRPVLKSSKGDSMDILQVISAIESELEANIRTRNTLRPHDQTLSNQAHQQNENDGLGGQHLNRGIPTHNCIFCGKHPNSNSCNTVQGHADRVRVLTEKGCCIRCLSTKHNVAQCDKVCYRCKGTHHFIICPVRKTDKPLVLSITESKYTHSSDKRKGGSSSHSNPSSDKRKSQSKKVRLWAGQAKVIHPETGESEWADFIIDSGSMRTLISDTLVHNMKLPIVGEEQLSLKGVGSVSLDNHQSYPKVKWMMQTCDGGPPLEISGIQMRDPIIDALPCHPLNSADHEFIRKSRIKLTDHPKRSRPHRPKILLGAAEMSRLLNPRLVIATLTCGLTVYGTRLGNILAGEQNLLESDEDNPFTFVSTLTEQDLDKRVEKYLNLDDDSMNDDDDDVWNSEEHNPCITLACPITTDSINYSNSVTKVQPQNTFESPTIQNGAQIGEWWQPQSDHATSNSNQFMHTIPIVNLHTQAITKEGAIGSQGGRKLCSEQFQLSIGNHHSEIPVSHEAFSKDPDKLVNETIHTTSQTSTLVPVTNIPLKDKVKQNDLPDRSLRVWCEGKFKEPSNNNNSFFQHTNIGSEKEFSPHDGANSYSLYSW